MSGVRALAVLSAENHPLFLRVGPGAEATEVEFALYAALDDLSERLDEHAHSKSRDPFLGEICTVADLTMFSHVLNSGVKFLLAMDEQSRRVDVAREVFVGLVGAYVSARANPFADLGAQLSSRSFEAQVDEILGVR